MKLYLIVLLHMLMLSSRSIQAGVNDGSVKLDTRNNNTLALRLRGFTLRHDAYVSYDQIQRSLQILKDIYPNNVDNYLFFRQTYEGRYMRVIKLSGSRNPNVKKPAIVIESGIHAREWISPAATLYVVDKLLGQYSRNDKDAKFMLDKFDWYVIPSTNPDGYEFSRTNNSCWRKNRRPIKEVDDTDCIGVDLNRNFDFKFQTSSNCSRDTYPGPHGFSEAETQNVRNLVEALKDRLVAYLSVHSYSQVLMVPWGNTWDPDDRPKNYMELDRVGRLMTSSLVGVNGKNYTFGTAAKVLGGPAFGCSDDWALSTKDSMYVYTYELRPHSSVGRLWGCTAFKLPADEIVPTGEEVWASLVTLATEMKV